MDTFYTSCEEVRRSRQPFYQYTVAGGERQRMSFEREVVWLLTSTSQLLFTHGGRTLKEGETHNDFYGYLSSLAGLHQEEYLAAYGITRESTLELIVKTTICLSPALETAEARDHNQNKGPNRKSMYAYIPAEWKHCTDNLPDEIPVTLGEQALVQATTWSSHLSEQGNAARLELFKEHWSVENVRRSVQKLERLPVAAEELQEFVADQQDWAVEP